MGGKSSSSSSSSTSTTQIDKRIAATDSANVITIENKSHGDVLLSDYDAIAAAGDLAMAALNSQAQITLQALGQTGQAVGALGEGTQKAYEFVDDQTRDESNRTLTDVMPWLIGGVSVLALAGAIKIRM